LSINLIRKIIREELGRHHETIFSPDSPAGVIKIDDTVSNYVIIDITSNTTDGRTFLSIVCKDHVNDEVKLKINILPVKRYFNSYNEACHHKDEILRIVRQQISS
jgi:hypothetical protein